MYDVLVTSNLENIALLKRLGLEAGRDFTSEKGAVKAGRPGHLLLRFKDREKALLFKLRSKS